MSGHTNPSNNANQSSGEPILLRMLHPTSGRQGFNGVNTQTAFPSTASVDPRLAQMIHMQTQRAISASGIPAGFPYQGPTIPVPLLIHLWDLSTVCNLPKTLIISFDINFFQ